MVTQQRAFPEATERQRQARQQLSDSEKSASQRNIMGQYATPFPLAVDVASAALRLLPPCEDIHFGEPSCGTGAFFSALLNAGGDHSIASAVGYEIDPTYADTARQLWEPYGFQVFTQDFTSSECRSHGQRPNLILANPPYVRHHHIKDGKDILQKRVKEATGISVSGLSGLYVYFMLIAHQWLAEGGLASWLIPSEFMDVGYGEAIKTYLTDNVTPISLHRFDPNDVQFDDALVSSAVVTFRKARPQPDTVVSFTYGGSLEKPAVSQQVSVQELRGVHKWTSLPERFGNRVRMKATEGLLLGDLFHIKRGIATGANGFFIMKREQAASLGIEEAALRPILPSPKSLKLTHIEAGPDGYPEVDPQLVMIDCDLPPSELAEQYPNLWAYLQTAQDKGIHSGYLVQKRQPWYKQEQRPPALFLSTYMGRVTDGGKPFRFILNRSQAVATNLFLALYPKETLARLVRDKPERIEDVFCLLNQIEMSDLRDEGRVYGGGLHKIEPGELARIPAGAFAEILPDSSTTTARQLAFVMEKRTTGYQP